MVARVATVAFQGIEVLEVDVQVQIGGGGMPVFALVGVAGGEAEPAAIKAVKSGFAST